MSAADRPSWRDRCWRCRFTLLRCALAHGCCIDCDHRPAPAVANPAVVGGRVLGGTFSATTGGVRLHVRTPSGEEVLVVGRAGPVPPAPSEAGR